MKKDENSMYIEEEIKNDSIITDDNIEEEEEKDNSVYEYKWKDRELSWLDYNYRVLDRAISDNILDEEKINFIGYASSNLDEFISVRFSELYNKLNESDIDSYYNQILEEINNQRDTMGNLIKNVLYNKYNDYIGDIDSNIDNIKDYFMTNIFPALTPISITNNKEIPVFNDNDINFLIKLKEIENNKKSTYCILQIPNSLNRIHKIESKYYHIENIIEKFLNIIFSNKTVNSYVVFRVNKDYSIEVSKDVRDKILTRVDDMLKKKRNNNIIFLEVVKNEYYDKLIKDLIKLTKVPKKHITIVDSNIKMGLEYLKNRPYKKILEGNKKIKSVVPSDLFGYDSILEYLDDNDELLLHHPYETYDLVVNFIKEAAIDPNTLTIKQTLYRVSSEKSPIIKALCLAAKNGVRVTVMLELLARFDEKQNLRLVEKLKSAGCTVIYSLDRIKTHCKICLVTKSTKKGIKTYSHIGTGNYNEKTSTGYADISYFTTNNIIASELASIFNMITGFSRPEDLKLISYSPITLRVNLTNKIQKWKELGITKVKIKVNSIADFDMMNTITKASIEGLKFDIICRGVCSLLPNENIEIHSVVGKILEHSRIYIFEKTDSVDEVYISSSDLLTRNLNKRIEVMVPIEGNKYKKKIKIIFEALFDDTSNSYLYEENGTWIERSFTNQTPVSCYDTFVIE